MTRAQSALDTVDDLSVSQRATRHKVLEAAAGLFYDRGVHAVGVNEIAAAAHASKLSLYRYFPSKEQLVEAMLREHSDRIHAWLRARTADAAPGADRVLSVFDLLIEWFGQPGYRGCTVLNTVTDTRARPAVAEVARRHLVRYRALLEERLVEIDVPEPAALARQLLLLIEGASVVSTIDVDQGVGMDARHAAEQLLACATTPRASARR